MQPWFDAGFGALRTAGLGTFQFDQIWPGVTDHALISPVIYLLAFDFVGIGFIAASTSWSGGGVCTRCITHNGR